MANGYKDFLAKFRAPPWLLKDYGHAYMVGLGDTLDMWVDRLKKAIKARMPDLAPTDALLALEEERGVVRGYGEAATDYRPRLKASWDAWQFGGTPYGMLKAMEDAGCTGGFIATALGKQYYLDVDGSLVVSDISWTMSASGWNVFAVVFPTIPPVLLTGGVLVAETTTQAQILKKIVQKWMPAHTICDGITLVTSGAVWGVGGLTWGAFTWGDAVTSTWTVP